MAGGGGGGGYNGGGGGSGGQIYYSQNIAVVAGNLIDITIGAGGGGGTNASKTGTVGASTSIAIPNVNAGTASYALGGNGGLPCNYILGSASCPNINRGGASIAAAGNGSAPPSGFGGYGRNFLGSSSSAGAGGTAYVNSVIALAPISLSGGGNGGDTAAGSNGVGYGAGGGGEVSRLFQRDQLFGTDLRVSRVSLLSVRLATIHQSHHPLPPQVLRRQPIAQQ